MQKAMDDFCIEVKSQNEYGVMFHKQWNTEKTDQVTGDKNVKLLHMTIFA